jgi:hypothetical protein
MDELLFCACNSEELLEQRVVQLLEQGAQPASHANEYDSRWLQPQTTPLTPSILFLQRRMDIFDGCCSMGPF